MVEKEPGLANALRAGLIRSGWEVLTAADGARAQALLEKGFKGGPAADCLLVDQELEGMTGQELVERVLAAHPDIHPILMTAAEVSPLLDWAGRLGLLGILAKPFTLDRLLDLITRTSPGRGPDRGRRE